MTNGDRIREMARTNEGLAKLISDHVDCETCAIECTARVCAEAVLDWLDEENLKPCPFCGEDKARILGKPGYYIVECKECGAQARLRETKKAAVDAWNRRAGNAD